MDTARLGMKTFQILSKPFNLLFGSDQKGFLTLFLVSMTLYGLGFPDAAVISAVYSAMFGFSGIAEMDGSASTGQGKDEGLEDMQDMMDDALSMAEDFKEEKEAKNK
jgi:hypothetical protein